jgi:hypothetical protein
MIDIGKILKRAWHILWNYRVLWIFGILLAITMGGRNGGNGGSSNSGYRFDGSNGSQGVFPTTNPDLQRLNHWFEQNVEPLGQHPGEHIATFVWIGLAVLALCVVVGLLFALVRYPSEVAVMRMVDEYEKTGAKVGFKQGWKLGWNRRAFRLWVIDLVVGLPVFLLVLILGGLGLLVFFSVKNGSETAIATSVIPTVGCAFLFIFAFIVLMVVLSLLRQFFARQAALEEAGIGDSFRNGWAMFKRNWKSAGLMWLVMLGIGIGVGLGMMIVFFLLIPAYLVMILPAAILGAIPGLIVFGIASIFTSTPWNAILGVLFGLPLFFTVLFAPLTFVNGWWLVYESSVWTLTYREIKALESVGPSALPEIPVMPGPEDKSSLSLDGPSPK